MLGPMSIYQHFFKQKGGGYCWYFGRYQKCYCGYPNRNSETTFQHKYPAPHFALWVNYGYNSRAGGYFFGKGMIFNRNSTNLNDTFFLTSGYHRKALCVLIYDNCNHNRQCQYELQKNAFSHWSRAGLL